MNNSPEKHPTVLVADDNQEILDLLADDLSENYEVIKVTNGQEAIDYLQENMVDLIVSDVMMPYVDGYELCARLKESVSHCHIPFILLTAKINLQYKIEGLNHGADAYIEKPFSPTYLQAQISSLLRNRHHVREHYSKSPETPLQSMAFNKADQVFLQKLNSLIMDNLSEQGLCVDMLADSMHMSRPTLYRKIKAISNLSPNELINITRLKRATELLIDREFKIYEISALVGFNSSSHFTRNFQKQFGISPKEYADSIENKTL
ncbi:response regulator [Sphingobacterium hungaricum]|uniref:Two-component system response regulator n=1 Tax=Sphingobacterium hungaricum TaxID=2082723 RepID=A0A928UY02_9SPHI|nr:response regulator [Sphingobacterium hungaricum]MBE8714063.1 two-component system response regulator [Sphingobacterium hungaricum]